MQARKRKRPLRLRGVTLVEMVVCSALTVVLFASAVAVGTSFLNIYWRVLAKQRAVTISNLLVNTMENDLKLAYGYFENGQKLCISSENKVIWYQESNGSRVSATVVDGQLRLTYDNGNTWSFGDQFYRGYSVEELTFLPLNADGDAEDALVLQINVSISNGTLSYDAVGYVACGNVNVGDLLTAVPPAGTP